jgi:hypothetical protein
MIDKKLGDKPIFFELSIGNAGNTLDGHNETTQEPSDSDSDDNLGKGARITLKYAICICYYLRLYVLLRLTNPIEF